MQLTTESFNLPDFPAGAPAGSSPGTTIDGKDCPAPPGNGNNVNSSEKIKIKNSNGNCPYQKHLNKT